MTNKELKDMTVDELIKFDTGNDPTIPWSCAGIDELIRRAKEWEEFQQRDKAKRERILNGCNTIKEI